MPEPNEPSELDETESIAPSLSVKQSRAIAALLEEPSITRAAAAAGISHATIHRWLQDPDFHRAYMHARWKAVQQSMARVQKASADAIAVVFEIMNDKKAPHYTRLAAANSVISKGLRSIELEDHDERISQIREDIGILKSQE
jgi:hypothetical protein